MQKLKNILLTLFTGFLFLGVCGVSVTQHLCTITEEVCEMHDGPHEKMHVKHDCCPEQEAPTSTPDDDDCCKEDLKVYQTSLDHYHDVLVKLPQFYALPIKTLDFYTADVCLPELNPVRYANPPPIPQEQFRALLQVYTI